jgi:hypothetical protein
MFQGFEPSLSSDCAVPGSNNSDSISINFDGSRNILEENLGQAAFIDSDIHTREGFSAEQDKKDYCNNTEEEKDNTSFFKEKAE